MVVLFYMTIKKIREGGLSLLHEIGIYGFEFGAVGLFDSVFEPAYFVDLEGALYAAARARSPVGVELVGDGRGGVELGELRVVDASAVGSEVLREGPVHDAGLDEFAEGLGSSASRVDEEEVVKEIDVSFRAEAVFLDVFFLEVVADLVGRCHF